jgi:hypothetical protein
MKLGRGFRAFSPLPLFAGEGWVRAFFLFFCAENASRKKTEDPHPTLSREGGRGLRRKCPREGLS